MRANVERCLDAGVPCVVGTTGLTADDLAALDERAREKGVACLVAPNFALGAVLMMRFAAEAARHMPRAEIVETHHETKVDAPSGTAKATAAAMGGDVPIHSVRLPGVVAHQEVLLGGDGQLLTIRHDTFSREAFVPASCSRWSGWRRCRRASPSASRRSSSRPSNRLLLAPGPGGRGRPLE